MKITSLNKIHQQLGAKMIEFAGYEMPVSYSGINDEHFAVREKAGIFDVSHMGEFMVKGNQATEFLNYVCSNNIAKLKDFQCQYNCFPNQTGGIIDDLIVYKWNENEYNLVVNASNIQKDWEWLNHIKAEKKFDIQLQNISDEVSLIALQGPEAKNILQSLTKVDLSDIKYYHFVGGQVADAKDVIISHTGYTGSGGYELYVWNNEAEGLWNALMKAGEKYGLMPCGLAARDTLRLEKGYCLYGNDINDETSPLEAGLGWITKFDKDFIAKNILLAQKEKGISKKLIGFEMIDKGIPRHDYLIKNNAGIEIGKVTSGTQSPMLKKGIGMGYVQSDYSMTDTEIWIEIRDKLLKAKVVNLPFIK